MKKVSRGKFSVILITVLVLSFVLSPNSVHSFDAPEAAPAGPFNVGDTIILTGASGQVTSGSEVKVYWDYATGQHAWLLNTTTGNPDGSYEVFIMVPETSVGTHYIWTVDVATGQNNGSLPVQIEPTLIVDPSIGLPGDTVTLTGYGFDAEAGFNVSLFNMTGGHVDVCIPIVENNEEETDVYGSFHIQVTIPSLMYSYNTLWFNVSSASSGTSFNVTSPFTVGASIVLTPDEGPRKSLISIAGRGFKENGVIEYGDIKVDGFPGNFTGDAIPVDPNGEFTCEIIIGNLPYGAHIINVSDGYYRATATFNVIRNRVDISLSSPENVSIGSIVEVNGVLRWDNGTGLGHRHLLVTYRILYGTQWKELSVIQTDVDGSLSLQWIPPATGEFLINLDLVDGLEDWVDRNRTQVGLVVSEVVASGFQLNLSAGWNMVSSFDREVNAEDVFPDFFQLVTWNGQGYVSVDVMEPGKGYWAIVLEDTNITVTG